VHDGNDFNLCVTITKENAEGKGANQAASYIANHREKYLRECYWSQVLIERLQQGKANGAKPEDVKHVAAECRFGDSAWAEELLASLRPPVEAPKSGGNKNRHHR